MNLTTKQINTLETTIDSFISTYQILEYDYEDDQQGNIAMFMERLENAYNEEWFNIKDMIDIAEDLFLAYPLKIDFDMLEKFNDSVEKQTITIEEVIPVFDELDGMLSEIVYYVENNMIQPIEDIKEYLTDLFFDINWELEKNLEDNQGYINYTLDYDQLLKDDYDPEVHEVNGNYYRIENTF